MPITAVGPAPTTRKKGTTPGTVRSIREITNTKRRIQRRAELPDHILAEFVKAINDACENGSLPYTNYRLNQSGSPNQVYAHYMSDTLDPVYRDTIRKLAQKDKVSLEEATAMLETRLIDARKEGLAFILTNDAKKFWYYAGNDLEQRRNPVLYHDWDNRRQSPEEKAIIEKLKKLLQSGNQDKLLNELSKL